MAIVVETTGSQHESGGGDDGAMNFDLNAPGSNRAALVGCYNSRDTPPTALPITYDSNAGTQAWTESIDDIRQTAHYFKDSEMGTGSVTVANTVTGGSGGRYGNHLAAVTLSGVDQTTPVGSIDSAPLSSGTESTVTVTSPASSSVIIDCCQRMQENATGTRTIGADQTERLWRMDNYNAGNSTTTAMSSQSGADGGAMSWTGMINRWALAHGAVEFKEAAAAAGGSTFKSFKNTVKFKSRVMR